MLIYQQEAILNAYTHSIVDFKKNSDWYPLYAALGRVLSYDVTLAFEGLIAPDVTCAYNIFIRSDTKTASIDISDFSGNSLLYVDRMPDSGSMRSANEYIYGPVVMKANQTYPIRLTYTTIKSTGTDPVMGDQEVEFVDREFRLLWSCPSVPALYQVCTSISVTYWSRNLCFHFR